MKIAKKFLAVAMALLMLLPAAGFFCFAETETTTGVIEEETTSPLDGILDKIENTDLGIDGFGITEMFGKIISWIRNLVDNIRAYIDNIDFGSSIGAIIGKLGE